MSSYHVVTQAIVEFVQHEYFIVPLHDAPHAGGKWNRVVGFSCNLLKTKLFENNIFHTLLAKRHLNVVLLAAEGTLQI